ncbi:GDSL-type esterase/lipase family protein [Roseomonas sp. NAR14]|uniref:GDSL-type esterase/lipase family protein n=1 Tax=Roseomonas acroporae TaxID=2937791 RepID=A0A9X1Y816_9PROT|nr:GDSL-type esterase/lipase family protein [Roseomonas acroporae]MCK8785253.1 GDSL-type esterase/lipase family protein [Roseomonas acroporae]
MTDLSFPAHRHAAPLPRRGAVLGGLAGLLLAGRRARAEEGGPLTIAVLGDSQAQGLAQMMLRQVRRDPRFRVLNRTKPATAISQPVIHDWLAVAQRTAEHDRPDIAVLMFGGNDRVPARPAEGRYLPFRSAAWLEFYRGRVEAILRAFAEAGIPVIWCGNPIAREANYSRDMQYLNGLFRDATVAAGGTYLDIWTLVADDSGRFVGSGPALDGSMQRLRTDDGIHFTMAGYDLVAARVMQQVRAEADRMQAAARQGRAVVAAGRPAPAEAAPAGPAAPAAEAPPPDVPPTNAPPPDAPPAEARPAAEAATDAPAAQP